jgi:hypothetical protein
MKTHLTQPIQLQPNLSFNSNSILQNNPIIFFFLTEAQSEYHHPTQLLLTPNEKDKTERERERGITPSLNSFISLNLNKTKPMNASYVNRNKHLHKTKALIKISFVEYTPICPKQKSFNTSNSFNQKITLKHQNPIQLFLNTQIYVWVQWYFVRLNH